MEKNNKEFVNQITETFIKIIARRTSKGFSILTLDTILQKLKPKYDFINYINIEKNLYSEGMNAVSIDPKINLVETEDVVKGVTDFIDFIAQSIGNGNYFFINEIRDELTSQCASILEKFDVNLEFKQFEYLFDKTENNKEQLMNKVNTIVLESFLKTLTSVLNKYLPELETMKTLVGFVNNLQNQYEVFKFLIISSKPDKDGFFNIEIKPEINTINQKMARDAYKKLILEVGKFIERKTNSSFIEDFFNEIDEEEKKLLEKCGIPLDEIGEDLRKNSFESITYKIFEVLIELIGSKTSTSYAVTTIETVLKKLKDKHDVVKYIKVDSSKYSAGIKAISIQPDIRNTETQKLGRCLKDIIKLIQDSIGGRTFIRDFKEKLGENLVQKVENIGVNLHVLELRDL